MPFNTQQQKPFNFNIDENGLLQLAQVADPVHVMHFLDTQAPGGSPSTTPPYAEQQPPAWSIPPSAPDPLAAAVMGVEGGGSAPAPPTPMPDQRPLPPTSREPNIGLGVQALSLLNSMQQTQPRGWAPSGGVARSGAFQFLPYQPAPVATRRPDLASIIYGRR